MQLGEIQKGKYFCVANGTVIRSVWELEPALQGMGEETFRYHVNNGKNDFSNWIADVLDDAELAGTVRGISDKQEMRIAVLRHLVKVVRNEAKP